MGATTKIEWADKTFNPWIGCTKVSPACDNCYAERTGKRLQVRWGHHEPRRRTSDSNWQQPFAWNKAAKRDGIRPRVFCASLADVFDTEVDPLWRENLFTVIELTTHLDWLILTKRPKVARDYFGGERLPANIWMGTTVENQAMADARLPHLSEIKAGVRFVSCEPLLGRVTLGHYLVGRGGRLHWVIAGGESGTSPRPTNPDWFRSLRDQCAVAGCPFFFKQWGEWAPIEQFPDDQRSCRNFGDAGRVARGTKKTNGNTLDGRRWLQFPHPGLNPKESS